MKSYTKTNTIPLKPDFDESKVVYIKHKVSREENGIRDETEIRIPSIPQTATAYQKPMFFEAFNRARTTMSWTTGPKLHQKFPMHLSAVHTLNDFMLAPTAPNHNDKQRVQLQVLRAKALFTSGIVVVVVFAGY